MKEKRPVPLIFNILKKVYLRKEVIHIKSICLLKFMNSQESINSQEIKLEINGKEFKIKFKFEKGLLFIKKYRFNVCDIEIPVKDIINYDIQNKMIIKHGDYAGRIIYSIFDLKKGRNRNSKVISYNKFSIYLRQTIKNTMYLTIRDNNEYDYIKGKLKLFIAWTLSKLCTKKNIKLLYEKNSSRYEESASVVYEELINQNYKNCYFIVDKNCEQIKSIDEKYKRNLLYKGTIKHLIYFFKCNTFIGSETIAHAVQLRIANKLVVDKINSNKNKYIFLQHGVMYMISLDSDMRTGFRKSRYKLFKIVVSSDLEAKHFIELGGFSTNDLYITGLAKFDKNLKNKDADKIVIMPTWRRWETNEARLNFSKTGYYRMLQEIVEAIPHEFKDKVIILPHPLIRNSMIESNSMLNNYLPKEESYDKILQNCKILITDYSSISYDAFYRGSNVIFYWKEKDDCLKKYGQNTKLMLTEDLAFGDICYDEKKLINIIKDNYYDSQKQEYIEKYKKIVQFNDNNNTERIIECLKNDEII